MSFFSWLASAIGNRQSAIGSGLRKPQAGSRKPPRFRPHLEILEGRDVPSTLTVTNNLDGPPGSLRAEIAAAQDGDTIVFSPSLNRQTITLSGGELYINKSLDIESLGAKNLAISGGNQGSRVFEIAAEEAPLGQRVQVTLSGITIENGNAVPSGGVAWDGQNYNGQGGGILNWGTLTLSGCTVTGNSASSGGGGVANEFGGTMTISGCTVTGNIASSGGGGGGIANEFGGTMTISGCTVSRNYSFYATTYGWRYGGGGIYNDGTMTLSGTTVTQNNGYGIWNSLDGNLTILNSTVKSNRPGDLVSYGTCTVDSSSTIG
jgi:hypothetical protein